MSVGSSVRVSASNRMTSSQYGGEGSVSWRYTRGDLTESAIPCRHHLRPSAYLRNDLTTDAYDCTVLLEHPSRSCFIISTSSTLLGEIVAKPSIRVLKLVKNPSTGTTCHGPSFPKGPVQGPCIPDIRPGTPGTGRAVCVPAANSPTS